MPSKKAKSKPAKSKASKAKAKKSKTVGKSAAAQKGGAKKSKLTPKPTKAKKVTSSRKATKASPKTTPKRPAGSKPAGFKPVKSRSLGSRPVGAKKISAVPGVRKPVKKAGGLKKPRTVFFDDGPDLDLMLDDEVVLRDAEGRQLCRVPECDQVAVVGEYCRFHYLALWKKITLRRKILEGSKLENYLRELTKAYSDKMIDALRKDLKNEKDFLAIAREVGVDKEPEEAQDEVAEDSSVEAQNVDELKPLDVDTDTPPEV